MYFQYLGVELEIYRLDQFISQPFINVMSLTMLKDHCKRELVATGSKQLSIEDHMHAGPEA